MSGQSDGKQQNILVDVMIGLDNQQQAECIAEHYSSISNQYQQVQASDFQEYLSSSLDGSNPAPIIEPIKVYNIIQKMNTKSSHCA